MTITTTLLIVITVTPLAQILTKPLEHQFAVPASLPDKIDGVVLVGGTQRIAATQAYGISELSAAADEMAFLRFARRYPNAKLLFAGGSGDLNAKDLSEADVFKLLLAEEGVDPSRAIFESQSRNTFENALFGKALAQPKAGENWILITSAIHMPRTIACFRRVGWPTIPYPVMHMTIPESYHFSVNAVLQFTQLEAALHEWIGLAVYQLTGRI